MTPSITPQVDTPIPAFLSPDELRALTGFTHAARQIAQLQTMGIAHYLNGAGRPVVARAAIEGRNRAAKAAKPWAPRVLSAG